MAGGPSSTIELKPDQNWSRLDQSTKLQPQRSNNGSVSQINATKNDNSINGRTISFVHNHNHNHKGFGSPANRPFLPPRNTITNSWSSSPKSPRPSSSSSLTWRPIVRNVTQQVHHPPPTYRPLHQGMVPTYDQPWPVLPPPPTFGQIFRGGAPYGNTNGGPSLGYGMAQPMAQQFARGSTYGKSSWLPPTNYGAASSTINGQPPPMYRNPYEERKTRRQVDLNRPISVHYDHVNWSTFVQFDPNKPNTAAPIISPWSLRNDPNDEDIEDMVDCIRYYAGNTASSNSPLKNHNKDILLAQIRQAKMTKKTDMAIRRRAGSSTTSSSNSPTQKHSNNNSST